MRITLEPTEKTTMLTARASGESGAVAQLMGQLWQGMADVGQTPVIAVVFMVTPDLPAEDPRQAMFEHALDTYAVPTPGVIAFPKEFEL